MIFAIITAKRFVPVWLLFWMTCFYIADPVVLHAQKSAEPILRLADSLERSGNTDDALHEYKRWLFFNTDISRTAEMLFKIGTLNEKSGRMTEAVIAYKQSSGMTADDGMRKEALYRAVLCQFLEGKIAEAVNDTEPLAQQTFTNPAYQPPFIHISDTGIKKILFIRLICLNEVLRTDDAQREARLFFPQEAHSGLDVLYQTARTELSKQKSESRSEWYSIIPGGGQWYAGNKKDAFVSFLMVGGLAVGTLTAIWYQHYLLGALGILPIGQKFYNGGRQYGKKLVTEYNNRLQNETAKKLNLYLLGLRKEIGN